MKHMLLNKILRNDKNTEAPTHWPDNIKQIEQEAVELKKFSHDLVKRLALCPIYTGCYFNNNYINILSTSNNNVWNNSSSIWQLKFQSDSQSNNDKNTKKLPEQNLAQCLQASSERLSVLNPNLSRILSVIGQSTVQLANERLRWACTTETNVISPLRCCLEDNVPNLVKNRRQLWKQSTELKALQDRLKNYTDNNNSNSTQSVMSPCSPMLSSPGPTSANCIGSISVGSGNNNVSQHDTEQASSPSSSQLTNNNTSATITANGNNSISGGALLLNCVSNQNEAGSAQNSAGQSPLPCGNTQFNITNSSRDNNNENNKLTQLKNNRDDLENQIDHLKDISLRDHYRFESSSIEMSKALINLLKNEANYHQQCLLTIGQVLPDLELSIATNPIPVFGRELKEHLKTSNRQIAYVIDVCIRQLDNSQVYMEEGLFRIAGGKSKVDTLSSAFNVFRAEKIIDNYDHYVVADCLKQYLRSLPNSLLTGELFNDWTNSINGANSHEEILSNLQQCLSKLPVDYFNNLSYLTAFLYKLTTYSHHNRMLPTSLGIIFGPTLLRQSIPESQTTPPNVIANGSQTLGRKKSRSVSNSVLLMRRNINASNNQSELAPTSTSSVTHHNKSTTNTILGALDLVEFDTGLLNQSDDFACIDNNNSMTKSMISSSNHSLIVEHLIKYFKLLFPHQSTQFSWDLPSKKVFQQSSPSSLTDDYSYASNGTAAPPQHPIKLEKRRMSIDSTSTCPNGKINVVSSDLGTAPASFTPKSTATTPTGKKTLSTELRNGTVFPTTLYRRRISDTTVPTTSVAASNNNNTSSASIATSTSTTRTNPMASSHNNNSSSSSNNNSKQQAPVLQKANGRRHQQHQSRSSNNNSTQNFIGNIDISNLPDIDSPTQSPSNYGTYTNSRAVLGHQYPSANNNRSTSNNDSMNLNRMETALDDFIESSAIAKSSRNAKTNPSSLCNGSDNNERVGVFDTDDIDHDDLNDDDFHTTNQTPQTKYVPKSFHADVYDTLFALQSLNFLQNDVCQTNVTRSVPANTSTICSGITDHSKSTGSNADVARGTVSRSSGLSKTDDYLNRVRSVYEGRTLSKSQTGSHTPLVRRQTFNTVEESMTRSVTNPVSSSTAIVSSTSESTSGDATTVVLRRPARQTPLPMQPQHQQQMLLPWKYRESSPATIESSVDGDCIVFRQTITSQHNQHRIKETARFNSSTNHHSNAKTIPSKPLSNVKPTNQDECSAIRYSMPLLPTSQNSIK